MQYCVTIKNNFEYGGMIMTSASKEEWIESFRNFADKALFDISRGTSDNKKQAQYINSQITELRNSYTSKIIESSSDSDYLSSSLLNEILLVTYSSYIVMLEYRNKVWKYEYMAFARRVGELWEPFCKLPFYYPIKPLTIIEPPDFQLVQEQIKRNATEYIEALPLSNEIKDELKQYYSMPWTLVDSGGIKLSLDLHFQQNGLHYNCDFKSGFSSNEKGNTNRLLLVASIYNSLGSIEKTILFVRQGEDENNHYLQTLKNSPYWEVYCAKDCYDAMKLFTGFDLRNWLDVNADWQNDISDEFKQHLEQNNLLKYLTW